jgi:hypothetical protein
VSTTTHPFTPEEIMAFLDGELDPSSGASITAHLDLCKECRDLVTKLRSTSQSLSHWQVGPLDSLGQERLLEAASSKIASNRLSQDQGWLRLFQQLLSRPLPWALACVVFALLIGTQLLRQRPASEKSIFARYKMTQTAPAPSAGPSVDDKAYSGAAGGGSGGATAYTLDGASRGDAVVLGHVSTEAPPPPPPAAGRTLSFETHSAGPMIARTVSLSIVVKDFDASRAMLDTILARHNGYAAELNVATPQGAARALQGSLRIPAPQLVAAVAELKALGRVEVETQNGEEVTQQHADLVARLKNSRETEQRLQDVLRTRTGKVKDVLEVEEEIARVRGEIEQMEAEQQNLEHRVSFATVDLKLAEEYKAQLTSPAPSAGMQLRNAIVNGFRNASESLLSIILFFAEAGPTLVLWLAILFLPARLLWRRYQRAYATSGSSLGA